VEKNLLIMAITLHLNNVQQLRLMMVVTISCFQMIIQSGSVDAVRIKLNKVGRRIPKSIGISIMFFRKTCIQVT